MTASISELSRHLGIARATVRKAIDLGMPRDPDGAAAWRQSNVDPERSKRGKAAPAGTAVRNRVGLVASRAKKIQIEADLAELQLLQAKKVLVHRDGVYAELSRLLSDLRANLLAIPSRLGAVVAAESDPNKAAELIETEILDVMAASMERVDAKR